MDQQLFIVEYVELQWFTKIFKEFLRGTAGP